MTPDERRLLRLFRCMDGEHQDEALDQLHRIAILQFLPDAPQTEPGADEDLETVVTWAGDRMPPQEPLDFLDDWFSCWVQDEFSEDELWWAFGLVAKEEEAVKSFLEVVTDMACGDLHEEPAWDMVDREDAQEEAWGKGEEAKEWPREAAEHVMREFIRAWREAVIAKLECQMEARAKKTQESEKNP